MDFDFFIFGVPTAFQIFPSDLPSEYEHYIQFYDGSKTDRKFIIQREQGRIRYTYLRYNMSSGTNRKGSFMGMSLVFRDLACTAPLKLLRLFDEVYERQLKEQNLIASKDPGKASFIVTDLAQKGAYLEKLRQVFSNNLQDHFSGDFKQYIPDNAVSNTYHALPERTSDTEIMRQLDVNLMIEITPQIPDVEPLDKKPAKRVTVEELYRYKKLPEEVLKLSYQYSQRWQDINTLLSTLSHLPAGKQSEKKIQIREKYYALSGELTHPFESLQHQLNSLKNRKAEQPDHTYLGELYGLMQRALSYETEKLDTIRRSAEDIKDVIEAFESGSLHKSKPAGPNFISKQRPLMVGSIVGIAVVLLIAALWESRPIPGPQQQTNIVQTADPVFKKADSISRVPIRPDTTVHIEAVPGASGKADSITTTANELIMLADNLNSQQKGDQARIAYQKAIDFIKKEKNNVHKDKLIKNTIALQSLVNKQDRKRNNTRVNREQKSATKSAVKKPASASTAQKEKAGKSGSKF